MDPLNDKELDQLLREWKAPSPPASLKSPLDRRQSSPWRSLLAYSVRIPLPVAALVFVLLVYLAVSNLSGPRQGTGKQIAQSEPISDGTKAQSTEPPPRVQPSPPEVDASARGAVPDPGRGVPVQPSPRGIDASAAPRKEQTASLAGFQVVPVLEPRIVRAPQ